MAEATTNTETPTQPGTEPTTPATEPSATAGETPADLDAWLATLTDEQRDVASKLVAAKFDTDTKGLKSALESERTQRKTIEGKLRDAAKAAEAGSEAQQSLTKMADDVAEADRKIGFYQAAHAAGVDDLELAYYAATKGEFFTRQGAPDLDGLKNAHPALFKMPAARPPQVSAGAGVGTPPSPVSDFNTNFRKALGAA